MPPRYAYAPALFRYLSLALGLAGVVGYLLWLAGGALVKDGHWVGVDFHVYYQTARVLGRGEDIYQAGIAPLYIYPPLLAALVLPLSALPVDAATIVWKLLQNACLLGAGALLTGMLPRAVRPLGAGLLLLGLLTVPVQDEIKTGESNSLVLLLLASALWLIAHGEGRERSRPAEGVRRAFANSANGMYAAAGALLALAVGIKVLPVLVVAYFWWRGPRPVAAYATGGFLALQLVSLALIPATGHYWLVEFPALFGQAFPFLDNQSINAFFSRALLPYDAYTPTMQLANGEAWRPFITWAANLFVLGATAWALWKGRNRGRPELESKESRWVRLLLEVGLVLAATHLVSGSTWLHHLIDLAVPLCGLLGAWWLRNGANAIPLGPKLVLPAVGLGAAYVLLLRRPSDWLTLLDAPAQSSPLAALLLSSAAMWVVVGFWLAAIRSDKGGPGSLDQDVHLHASHEGHDAVRLDGGSG